MKHLINQWLGIENLTCFIDNDYGAWFLKIYFDKQTVSTIGIGKNDFGNNKILTTLNTAIALCKRTSEVTFLTQPRQGCCVSDRCKSLFISLS